MSMDDVNHLPFSGPSVYLVAKLNNLLLYLCGYPQNDARVFKLAPLVFQLSMDDVNHLPSSDPSVYLVGN